VVGQDGDMHDAHPLPGEDVIADGVRLHVIRHGRGASPEDPVLLFVHGAGGTGRMWCDVARDLEHTQRSVIPDLAGCGDSERASRDCGAQRQAELLAALLDTLDHPSAVVVAHGTGGAVAARLAALAPQRVVGIALIATPLHVEPWHEAIAHATRPAALAGRTHHPAADALVRFATPLLSKLAGGAGDAEGLDTTRAALAREGRPVLVLWGADDAISPVGYGERLAGELGATWVPIPDAGHDVVVERPERVAEELGGFIAESKIVV
jgi:pimeloyl-ACP methyl ester carboxylesterase